MWPHNSKEDDIKGEDPLPLNRLVLLSIDKREPHRLLGELYSHPL